MPLSDPYDLLGLLPDATRREIRAAYRRRAADCHPDRQPPDKKAWALEQMVQLNAARDLLFDPHQRAQYHRDNAAAIRWKMEAAQAARAQAPNGSAAPYWAWGANLRAERRRRRMFRKRVKLALAMIGGVIMGATAGLLLLALSNSAELRAQVSVVAAAFGVWLSLAGSMIGALFIAVLLALLLAGLGQLLKR
ncbi:MAG: DnaJ domain-containing protein [Anaerolineales bacterium]